MRGLIEPKQKILYSVFEALLDEARFNREPSSNTLHTLEKAEELFPGSPLAENVKTFVQDLLSRWDMEDGRKCEN